MNKFNRYIWLINTLRSYHYGATLEQLRSEWFDSDLNAKHSELNARTFFRWKEEVMDQFGIIIECDPNKEYRYQIKNDTELECKHTTAWMLHTMTVSNIIEEFKADKDKIILDEVPSGEEYLIKILQSIKSRYQLQLTYQPYLHDDPLPMATVNPLCIRLYDRRWYMVVDYVEENKRRVLALDRIYDLQSTKTKFDYPQDFDAHEYFKYDVGIAVGFEEEPCKIRLQINAWQRPYTRDLHLHSSQREIATQDDYSVFEYYAKPNNDFARAILPFGQNIKVLEPEVLRKKVIYLAYVAIKNQ